MGRMDDHPPSCDPPLCSRSMGCPGRACASHPVAHPHLQGPEPFVGPPRVERSGDEGLAGALGRWMEEGVLHPVAVPAQLRLHAPASTQRHPGRAAHPQVRVGPIPTEPTATEAVGARGRAVSDAPAPTRNQPPPPSPPVLRGKAEKCEADAEDWSRRREVQAGVWMPRKMRGTTFIPARSGWWEASARRWASGVEDYEANPSCTLITRSTASKSSREAMPARLIKRCLLAVVSWSAMALRLSPASVM